MFKDFSNLKQMILKNSSDHDFIRYINSLALYKTEPENKIYEDRINEMIDFIKSSEDSSGNVTLPDKFEKARFLVLQLESVKLKDVVELTNELK